MNWMDKQIAKVSPQRALKRSVARKQLEIMNNYGDHGASEKKKSMIGWRSHSGSVLEDVEYNIPKLRERSRDLYMGAPLANGALKTIRTNTIGQGLKLNPQIDHEYLGMSVDEAEEWKIKTQREFALWADTPHCDAQRMNNFEELQQLAFLSWLMSGDSFALLPTMSRPNMPYDLRIRIIEADRVSSPNGEQLHDTKIVNGVEVGRNGEVLAYHIAQEHPGSMHAMADQRWVRVRKYGYATGRPNIIHLMESERPEQRRGVPILAPVIESLKQISRYTEAELMAAVVSGMYTVFIKSTSTEDNALMGNAFEGDEVDEADPNSLELGNGSIVALEEGEEIQESNPNRPNTAFDGFVMSITRQVGASLELPYELLIKHFTSSYSASRGALLEAWKMFRMRRSWMAADFCQPIYEEWLAEAVAKGRIYAPGFFDNPLARKSFSKAEWNGPSQGQLDPLKEVNAAEKRVENGFSTRARETVELTGGDFKRNHQQRVQEEEMRRRDDIIPRPSRDNTLYREEENDEEDQD
ncbi:phage portal protein [Geomicrobium sp. JCM 19037]|uniref:phage portal protein n=1 Tax=Geomicrobium sp. JCM 19037 TaxID=1460634 RepID=UPI00045F4A7C|nr:phage portal protein [Geomicrobium sp. JCM 19037]GAK06045.1 phage portal protein [Geomicrobium sp. JCM 19037]